MGAFGTFSAGFWITAIVSVLIAVPLNQHFGSQGKNMVSMGAIAGASVALGVLVGLLAVAISGM